VAAHCIVVVREALADWNLNVTVCVAALGVVPCPDEV